MDKIQRIGQFVKSVYPEETYEAYIPNPLPPAPSLDMAELYELLDQATAALGRLDGMRMVLPDASLFLYMYVRKEAVLSAQIEGTQSSLSDLLLFESGQTPESTFDDVKESSSYVAAMYHGIERLKKLPISLRLIREVHAKLMNNSRGSNKEPGEFRRSQNWIGGTRPGNAIFVPPPSDKLMECLSEFEKFLHNENIKLPALIKAALAHVQFETIHPFLDGNGRLGRLLITLILCNEGILKDPLLYLSLYLKTNRNQYYEHLQAVRFKGEWEEWVKFFLIGVKETAEQATETARSIINLFSADRKNIESSGRSTAAIFAIHTYLQRHPVTVTSALKKGCKLSLPTVLRSLGVMESLGIVSETTGKGRHKIFVYKKYLEILNEGTET